MHSAPPSLDDCIASVKQSVSKAVIVGESLADPLKAPLELSGDLYNLVITPEILWTPDPIDQIRAWYPLVLKRAADDAGYLQYSRWLAKGTSALEIFFSLCASQEAKQVGVQIQGFGLGPFLYQVSRVARRLKLGFITRYWMIKYEALLKQKVLRQTSSRHRLFDSPTVSRELQQTWALLQNNIHQVETLVERYHTLQKQYHVLQKSYAMLQAKQTYVSASAELSKEDVEPRVAISPDLAAAIEAYYVSFEDVHRGSTEQIQAGLNDYQVVIDGLVHRHVPALDLGCGRGEWLRWLRERGINAKGVDSNAVMVRLCQAQGLAVSMGDVLSALRAQASHSLSMVSAFHVIEHLPFEVLFAMVQEIHRVLVPGGLMILETPNPENILVGSHTFYHDFSHQAPITPTSIEFLAQYHGFVSTEILRRNPYPRDARVLGSDPLTERVNGHLCGPQDFALIARTPLLD